MEFGVSALHIQCFEWSLVSVPYAYSVLNGVWLQFEFYFVDTSLMVPGIQASQGTDAL